MSNDGAQPAREATYGFLLYVGLAVGSGGAAWLYQLSKQAGEVSDFAHYGALGAVIAGVVLCYISSLPRAEAIAWVRSGLTALAVAFVFRWAVGEPYRIPSSSMEPTLNGDPAAFHGDRVWVNKWWYGWKWPFTNTRILRLHDPQRWDIVVFNAAEKDAAHPVLVKRVVGLPGERIHIEKGTIYANGQPLTLPPDMPRVFYTSNDSRMRYGVDTDDEFAVVPQDHYLVCGDNSANSRDGRYSGWLPNENIVGRVASVWWPLGHLRDFTGFSKTWWWRGLVGALVAWIFIRLVVGRSYPTYGPGGKGIDHYWVSFVAYGLRFPFWGRFVLRWNAPRRGDLVLYTIRGEGVPSGAIVAARVAGLPGERIAFVGEKCLINNAPLSSEAWQGAAAYVHPATSNANVKNEHATVNLAEKEYYVLCEDAADPDPFDSRVLGPVSGSAIVGRITRRWWPPRRAGRM